MGASISTPYSPAIKSPCTTSTTLSSTVMPTSTSKAALLVSTSISATPVPTQKTSTTSSAAAATSSTANFYLKSSCDNSCLGVFADDDQIYSNVITSTNNTFNSFYLKGDTLYDASTGTLCVSSEAGGSATRFQCSNNLDSINGQTISGGWGSSGGLLTYQSSSTWYGCGVLDLTNNYEPNGLTYSTLQGDPSNCRACTFSLVSDIAQCSGQVPAVTTSAAALPPCTTLVTSAPPSSSTTASSSSTLSTKTTATTTAIATPTAVSIPVNPYGQCGAGRCGVNWLTDLECFIQDCSRCLPGTWCQQYQFWPAQSQWACLPLKWL